MCHVEKQHEITVYIHIVSYLESRVRVVNARRLEKRPVGHD